MNSGKLWLGLGVGILLTAGAVSVYFGARGGGESVSVASAPIPAPAAPAPSPPVPPAVTMDVDSREGGYAMTGWRPAQGTSGWVDGISLAGGQALPDRPLTDADVLEMGGWAGDVGLGLRARFVIVAICGQAIATPAVGGPRPDVAERAHPNLLASGWQARIAVKHMPRCADPTLEVWVPVGAFPAAVALEGGRVLKLAPPGGPAPNFRSPERLSSPPETGPAPRRVIVTGQGSVNLRRCAGTNCASVGQLPAGPHMAVIAEESADWILIALPSNGRAGWIAKRLVRVE